MLRPVAILNRLGRS